MFDSPGTPGYPPPRNTWEFPPPEVSTRWKWFAAAVGLLGLLVGAALTSVVALLGTDDFAGLIDDEALTDTIASQCVLMTLTVESMPLSGTTYQQAATIADQNEAVELMVRSIRRENAAEIRTDSPAEDWLLDWDRLVLARDQYARELVRSPRATLDIPLDPDGHRITDRMDDVWIGEPVCAVPDALVRPYTDAYTGA